MQLDTISYVAVVVQKAFLQHFSNILVIAQCPSVRIKSLFSLIIILKMLQVSGNMEETPTVKHLCFYSISVKILYETNVCSSKLQMDWRCPFFSPNSPDVCERQL